MSVTTWRKHSGGQYRLLSLVENLIWCPYLGSAAGDSYTFLSHTAECSLLCGRVRGVRAVAWPLWWNIKTQGKNSHRLLAWRQRCGLCFVPLRPLLCSLCWPYSTARTSMVKHLEHWVLLIHRAALSPATSPNLLEALGTRDLLNTKLLWMLHLIPFPELCKELWICTLLVNNIWMYIFTVHGV